MDAQATEQPIQPVYRTEFTLELNHFIKTIEGKRIVESQKLFCLAGTVYQGYMGAVIECQPGDLSEREVDELIDVDGTKSRIRFIRQQRGQQLASAKEAEFSERRARKTEQQSHAVQLQVAELQLARMQREDRMAAGLTATAESSPAEPAVSTLPEPEAPQAFEPVGAAAKEVFPCPVCRKSFNSARKMGMHRVGAKH